MPPRKNNRKVNVKASEAVVSRMLAAALGVGPVETLEDFVEAIEEADDLPFPILQVLDGIEALFPWTVDVGREIMGDRTDLQTTLASDPGTLYVVNDSQRSGKDGLWLAIAEPSTDIETFIKLNRVRGLFHTIEPSPGDISNILAIQLTSCLTT